MNSTVPSSLFRGCPRAGSSLSMWLVVITVKIPLLFSTPSRQFSRQSKLSRPVFRTDAWPLALPPPAALFAPAPLAPPAADAAIRSASLGLPYTFSRPWKTLSKSSNRAMHGTWACISAHDCSRSSLSICPRE